MKEVISIYLEQNKISNLAKKWRRLLSQANFDGFEGDGL